MIKAILILNTSGKVRLIRVYDETSITSQAAVISELHQKIGMRRESYCAFIDDCVSVIQPNKVVYRQKTLGDLNGMYATLIFCFIIDEAESELAVLDLIQVLVEVLDKSFENVCELDLIFNPDKLQYILDEIVVDGMVTETNINEIVTVLKTMDEYTTNSSGNS